MKKYQLSDILVQDAVIQAVKYYGIEGAEQKIKELYPCNRKLREAMLKAWKEIYQNDKNKD